MTTRAGLLDTSVLIAREVGRPPRVEVLPEQTAVNVVTIAELHVGVLAAADVAVRAQRLGTLEAAGTIAPIPVTAEAARRWAELRVRLAEQGRGVNVNDLWIAAVALARRLKADPAGRQMYGHPAEVASAATNTTCSSRRVGPMLAAWSGGVVGDAAAAATRPGAAVRALLVRPQHLPMASSDRTDALADHRHPGPLSPGAIGREHLGTETGAEVLTADRLGTAMSRLATALRQPWRPPA